MFCSTNSNIELIEVAACSFHTLHSKIPNPDTVVCVSNSPPWCRLRAVTRLQYNSRVKMAEGELNVDSLISRLLEGEEFELCDVCVCVYDTGQTCRGSGLKSGVKCSPVTVGKR